MKRATVLTDQTERQRILLSPLFLSSVAVLVLNDFYLKAQFGNFLTGKLSDFAGLFAFPLFFIALLPRRRLWIYIVTAFGFTFWKTPFANGFIESWNLYIPAHIGRTIDYGDLVALCVLPLSYLYAGVARQRRVSLQRLQNAATVGSVLFSLFAFTATQLVRDRTVYIGGEYEIDRGYLELEVEPLLRKNPSIVSISSTARLGESHEDLQTNSNWGSTSDRRKGRIPKTSPTVPPVYWFDVSIAEKTCNSEKSKFSFIVERKENVLKIRAINLDFDCSEYEKADNFNTLDKNYIAHGRQMFEQHVINHLTNSRPE